MVKSTKELHERDYTVEELYELATMYQFLHQELVIDGLFIVEAQRVMEVTLVGLNLNMARNDYRFSYFKVPEGVTHISNKLRYYTEDVRCEGLVMTQYARFGAIITQLLDLEDSTVEFPSTLKKLTKETLDYFFCNKLRVHDSLKLTDLGHKCYIPCIERYR